MNFKSDICIVGLKCYDLLSGASVPRYLGGIEKQLVSLARGLVGIGKRVSFITYDHGQKDVVDCHGIRVLKSYSPTAGVPGFRFFHPRMTKLWAAMKNADASIYIQMGAGSETGVSAFGCMGKKKFVFFIACNADCDGNLPMLPHVREKILYKFGLRSANLILAQTRKQAAEMHRSFNRNSQVIPLPCSWAIPEALFVPKSFPKSKPARILWVGRIIKIKRLEWFIDAAEKCPEVNFDVVGTPNTDSDYFAKLKSRMESMVNVTMHGRVSDDELNSLYSKASLLCCTSEIEGFPTTFLEAWNIGLPVLTTFDPDGIVRNNGIGFVVETFDQFVEAINYLLSKSTVWHQLAHDSRLFFKNNYTSEALLPRFEKVFNSLAGG